jgi:hypothetical protein
MLARDAGLVGVPSRSGTGVVMTNECHTAKKQRKARTVRHAPARSIEYWDVLGQTRCAQGIQRVLINQGLLTATEISSALALAERLDVILETTDPSRAADRFLLETDDRAERVDRLAVLNIVVLTNGVPPQRVPWPITHPDEASLRQRPLRPLELVWVLVTARQLYGAASLVMCMLGAVPGEYPRILPANVHITRGDSGPGCVDLPGEPDPSGVHGRTHVGPRTVDISPWAAPILAAHMDSARFLPETPILTRLGQDIASNISDAVTMRVKNVFEHTGHHWDPTVKPLSIRNGMIGRVWDTDGPAAALAFSGWSNPKVVERAIGIRPRRPRRVTSPAAGDVSTKGGDIVTVPSDSGLAASIVPSRQSDVLGA